MTIHEEAEKIVWEARNLKLADAVQLTAARLEHIRIKGEKAGIEAARQAIREMPILGG